MPLFIFSPAFFAVSQLSCNDYGSTNSLSTCFAHFLLIILLPFPHKCPWNVLCFPSRTFLCVQLVSFLQKTSSFLSFAAPLQQFVPYFDMKQVHTKVLCWGCLLPLNWRCKNSAGKEHQLQISFCCPQLCRMLPCC